MSRSCGHNIACAVALVSVLLRVHFALSLLSIYYYVHQRDSQPCLFVVRDSWWCDCCLADSMRGTVVVSFQALRSFGVLFGRISNMFLLMSEPSTARSFWFGVFSDRFCSYQGLLPCSVCSRFVFVPYLYLLRHRLLPTYCAPQYPCFWRVANSAPKCVAVCVVPCLVCRASGYGRTAVVFDARTDASVSSIVTSRFECTSCSNP